MGAIDLSFRKYLSNDYVFADVVNQALAITDSSVRISPCELKPLDSSQVKSFGEEWRHDDKMTKRQNKSMRRQLLLERNRDAIRRYTFKQYGGAASVLGVEVQAVFDRTMPIRIMVYEGISLTLAWESMMEQRRLEDTRNDSIINEMSADDFIPSAYTCVLGIEGKSSDWPKDLHDITRFPMPEWQTQISNVPLHVVTITELAERPLDEFMSDLGIVARVIFHADNTHTLMDLLNDDTVQITSAGADVILACTGFNIKLPKTKEVSMLTFRERVQKMHQQLAAENREIGLKEGMEKGMEKGMEIGLEKGREENSEIRREEIQKLVNYQSNMGFSEADIVKCLVAIFPLTQEQAWTDVRAMLKME